MNHKVEKHDPIADFVSLMSKKNEGFALGAWRFILLRMMLIISLFVPVNSMEAQIDTEFWFAAPGVTEGHDDRPIVLRFTAFDADATVVVSQPANPSFAAYTVNVAANQSRTLDLTTRIALIENEPANRVLNKGIHIVSDQPITAYYEVNSTLNPDIFSLKGRNGLGKEFVIPAQNFWSKADWYQPPAHSAVDIVATSNNTRVTIIPSVNVAGHTAGQAFSINLDRGQTYSLVTRDFSVGSQLTGTIIRSDQFIAVTIKDDSNQYSPCLDLGGDQIVPIDVLGMEYIVVRGFLEGGDRVFIQAVESNTVISINGRANAANLNAGEMFNFLLTEDIAFIESSNPVYVIHATGFGCEIGMALLPKLHCTGSESVSFTRSTDENFGIILITKAGNEDGFRASGGSGLAISASQFSPVPATNNEYVAAQINLTSQGTANTAFQITNELGTFHLGTINGGARSGCRYGYFSDFKTLKVLTEASKICLGSELLLRATGSDQYQWFGSSAVDGLTTAEITVSPDSNILYGVVGSDGANECLDTAYIEVEVFEWPRPEIEVRNPCIQQQVELKYTGTEALDQVRWIIAGDTLIGEQNEVVTFSVEKPTDVEMQVQAINPAGCHVDTSWILHIAGVDLLLDSVMAITLGEGTEIEHKVVSGDLDGTSFQWTPAMGLSCNDCPTPVASPLEETTYQLTVVDSTGCTYILTTHIFVDSPIYAPNAFTPNHDGVNDDFEIFGRDVVWEELSIFDRWGQQIYVSNSSAPKWNGRAGESLMSSGTYVWLAKGYHKSSKNPIETSGTVHLIR